MFKRVQNGETYDLDANGDVAPTVTPGATPVTKTLTISALPGRTGDMWTYVDALWVKVSGAVTQSTGSVLNRDKLWPFVQSFQLTSPILGELIPVRFGLGSHVGLIDQYLGSRFRSPIPYAAQISASNGNYNTTLYYRIPFALSFLDDPTDTCPWAPFLEKSKLDVNINATTASLFQTGASIQATTTTIKAWFSTIPKSRFELHTPFQFRRYEYNTSGNQVKLLGVGADNGMDGINPGSRIAFMAWLSNLNGLGGVSTVDQITRFGADWRYQRSTQNPESYLAEFYENAGIRPGAVGSIGAVTQNDLSGWPWQMGALAGVGADGGVMDAGTLFFPICYPGNEQRITKIQKQVGDLNLDFSFTSNPNGNHVVRTLELLSWKPDKARQLASIAGIDLRTHDLVPDLDDGVARPLTRSMVGLPIRAVARGRR